MWKDAPFHTWWENCILKVCWHIILTRLATQTSKSSSTCPDNEAVEGQTPLKGIHCSIKRMFALSSKITCVFYHTAIPVLGIDPKVRLKIKKQLNKVVHFGICSSKRMETIKCVPIRNWLCNISAKCNSVIKRNEEILYILIWNDILDIMILFKK